MIISSTRELLSVWPGACFAPIDVLVELIASLRVEKNQLAVVRLWRIKSGPRRGFKLTPERLPRKQFRRFLIHIPPPAVASALVVPDYCKRCVRNSAFQGQNSRQVYLCSFQETFPAATFSTSVDHPSNFITRARFRERQ